MAVQQQFPEGIREYFPTPDLVSDNGCQPTSKSFAKACKGLGIGQIFTAYNNPKGNADTERFFRTIKEDLIWLREWDSFDSLKEAIAVWIEKYNKEFPHSSIGWMTPYSYERWFNSSCRKAG